MFRGATIAGLLQGTLHLHRRNTSAARCTPIPAASILAPDSVPVSRRSNRRSFCSAAYTPHPSSSCQSKSQRCTACRTDQAVARTAPCRPARLRSEQQARRRSQRLLSPIHQRLRATVLFPAPASVDTKAAERLLGRLAAV